MVIPLVLSEGMFGPEKWSFMFFVLVLSQTASRPGDLSADIARVGDVVGDMIGFNVLLNVWSLIFFSTHVA